MENLNDNDIERPIVVGKRERDLKAYATARSLSDKFNNPKGLRFYLGVAYNIPESTVWQFYELATTKKGIRSPARYFSTLCNNHLKGRTLS